MTESEDVFDWSSQLDALLGKLHDAGYVVTVELRPTYPLRMGGHYSYTSIRPRRETVDPVIVSGDTVVSEIQFKELSNGQSQEG